LIELAYTKGKSMGLVVLTGDEAGPYQAIPHQGQGWHQQSQPGRVPHEYERHGSAKMLTLFHPDTGKIWAKGVTSTKNEILHPWYLGQVELAIKELGQPTVIKQQSMIVQEIVEEKKTINTTETMAINVEQASTQTTCKPDEDYPTETLRAEWNFWQTGLTKKITLPKDLPRLRGVMILDNLAGHKSAVFVLALISLGIMPLYTPLGGSWLNMSESVQRIIVRRALPGTDLDSPEAVIEAIEATVRGWNKSPTPFTWGGKRQGRRERARQRQNAKRLGGSGACTIGIVCGK
jgi:hypothetical protein